MPSPRLLNRDFLLLWQGQLVSQLGSQAFTVATMFWTMEVTGSASVMGVLLMAATLPGALLGPFGGTFADRHSRLRIIVISDTVRGAAVLAFAGAMLTPGVSTGLRLTLLFCTTIVSGIVGAFFNPAIAAAIPDLVPPTRLAGANSMHQFSAQAASMIGQAVGGVLYRVLGAPVLFLADGVSYLLSALSEMFIRLPARHESEAPVPDGKPPFLRATREGLAFVWDRRGMRNFFLTAAVFNFLMMPIFVLLPFYVQDFLDATVEWYGFLLAAVSGGAVLGFLAAGALTIGAVARARLVLALLVATPLAIATLGVITRAPVAFATFAVIGVMSGMINVYVMTLLQTATPPEFRGRVLGLLVTLSSGLSPIGLALGGVVGDLTGRNVPLVYAGCGALAVLVGVSFALRRECRAFLAAG